MVPQTKNERGLTRRDRWLGVRITLGDAPISRSAEFSICETIERARHPVEVLGSRAESDTPTSATTDSARTGLVRRPYRRCSKMNEP